MERSTTPKSAKPVKAFRLHGVAASVFANSTEDGETYHKVQLQRTYRQDNEWKTTQSLSRDDLPIAALLLEQAWAFILQTEADKPSTDAQD